MTHDDSTEALRVAGPHFGALPFTPPDASDGELALEFRWHGWFVTWVTDGVKHFVAILVPVPFSALFGSWEMEPTSYRETIEGVPVHEFPGRPYPKEWLDSERGRSWLAKLDLKGGDSVGSDGTGLGLTFDAGIPQADLTRVIAFLDALTLVTPDTPSSNDPPTAATDARLRGSAGQYISRDLLDAIATFRTLLTPDDADRGRRIDVATTPALKALTRAVSPFLGQINAALDRFDAMERPLSAHDAFLESDLHALAQATEEAKAHLEPS